MANKAQEWTPRAIDAKIQSLIADNAIFVCNHSGGKDSHAMLEHLRMLVPAAQLLVVHADLPGVEWDGTWEKVLETSEGLEVLKTCAVKTFEDMVIHRGYWPSPKYRQCTSDLKRGPLEKLVRHWLVGCECTKVLGGTTNCRLRHAKVAPKHGGLVVNCMGLRAGESPKRSKAEVFKLNKSNSKAGRTWYDWLPIHDWNCRTDRKFDAATMFDDVFGTIEASAYEPHWAYQNGMDRLSCVFCIMGTKQDLNTAANLNPDLFAKFVALEQSIDQTFVMPAKGKGRKFLPEVTGIEPDFNLVAMHLARLNANVVQLNPAAAPALAVAA